MMTWETTRFIIAVIAVLVPVYLYMRRLRTNHIEGLRKDIGKLGEKLQICEHTLRSEIAAVHDRLNEHIQYHLENPGGGDQ
jgi:hypothetical protein